MILRFYTVLNGGAICCADYVVSSHIVEGIVYYEHSPCYVAHVVSSHGHILSPAICGPLLVALLAFVPAPPLQVSDSLHVCMGMLPGPAEREVRGSERDSC